MKKTIFKRTIISIFTLLAIALGSTVIKIWPENYFWIERKNAHMPVCVRGNIDSGIFIVLNHGGPGGCGTAESLFEGNPANGQFDHASPLQVLENDYAVVYWDQRHSGMSTGNADPNDSQIEDFGEDLSLVIRELSARYEVQHLFLIGTSWGQSVIGKTLLLLSELTYLDKVVDYLPFPSRAIKSVQNLLWMAARSENIIPSLLFAGPCYMFQTNARSAFLLLPPRRPGHELHYPPRLHEHAPGSCLQTVWLLLFPHSVCSIYLLPFLQWTDPITWVV